MPKNLKTHQRNNTIVEKGLCGLALLQIHSEIIPDFKGVIDKFAEDNTCLKFAFHVCFDTLLYKYQRTQPAAVMLLF